MLIKFQFIAKMIGIYINFSYMLLAMQNEGHQQI